MTARVAVIGGGQNCEHEVSLASAAGVATALAAAGHEAVRLTVGRDGVWRDAELRPVGLAGAVDVLGGCDAAFPVLHGPRGEDGTVAALCELAGIPYVGSGVRAGAAGLDKWLTKLVAGAAGIATAPGVLLTPATAPAHAWTRPVVVKPVTAGSSHGVGLVRDPGGLPAALAAAFALDDRILVEDLVSGREIDLAVIGRPDGSRLVAPALEIMVDGIFGHREKYDGGAEFVVPAPLTGTERKDLEEAAVAMYDALGCAGVARIDFFLTAAGPVLNEVNTAPGFTAQSQVPKMFAAAGTSYPGLVDLLVRDVLGTRPTEVAR